MVSDKWTNCNEWHTNAYNRITLEKKLYIYYSQFIWNAQLFS